jgi:MFS family permease
MQQRKTWLKFLKYDLNRTEGKIITLASLGGMLEFYDFTIYGLFSVYFAKQFFPSDNHLISIIASYVVFVVGYIARPIGGIIFSHIGDEIGRKAVLIITMALMGFASLGLGLLPTYAQIGIWAPILMLLCRLTQGLAIGGELPGMIVYVSESMPNKQGYGMGGIFAGTVSGLLPGMLINMLLTQYLTLDQINSFGWRIPFILGGLLCFVAYLVRSKLHETRAFNNLKIRDRFPFVELLQHHFSKVMIGVGLVSIMATPIILVIIFMPTYLTKIIKLDHTVVSNATLVATVVSTISIYAMGIIVNKFNIYKLVQNLAILIIFASGLCYFAIANSYNLMLALSIFAIFQGLLVPLPAILLCRLFPTHIRLSGVALSYNISFVIFGGMTPIIVTGIINLSGLIYIAPMICLTITSAVTLLALYKARKYV